MGPREEMFRRNGISSRNPMTINDINAKISFLTKTNTSSYPAADRLIAVNNAYERIASLIINADGRWQFDDTNQTDRPVATTALVASQTDYTLATTHLRILQVEVKDTNGYFYPLTPIDPRDFLEDSLTTAFSVAGVPQYYDVIGTSIFLYPAPNYSQSASLRVSFQRSPALFTSAEVTTGTKEPGFNSLYHDLIPLWVAYDYAIANAQPTANGYLNEIVRKEEALVKDYAMRNKDDPAQITIKGISFK